MIDIKSNGKKLIVFVTDREEFEEFVYYETDDVEPDDATFNIDFEYDALDEAGLLGNGYTYTDAEYLGHTSGAPVIFDGDDAYYFNDYAIRSWLMDLWQNDEAEFEWLSGYEDVAPILYGDE